MEMQEITEETVEHALTSPWDNFFVTGALFLLVFFYVNRRGFFSGSIADKKAVPVCFLSFLTPFTLFFVLALVFQLVLTLLRDSSFYFPSLAPYMSNFNFIGIAFFVLLWVFRRDKETFRLFFQRNLSYEPPFVLKKLVKGVSTWPIAFVSVMLTASLIGLILYLWTDIPNEGEQLAVRQIRSAVGDPILFVFSLLMVSTLVPFLEELLFRGYLQQFLRGFLPPWISIFGSSFLFAFVHYSSEQGAKNFDLLPSLFVLSLYLGYLMEREESLWAPIGLHAAFNSVSVLMIFLTSYSELN